MDWGLILRTTGQAAFGPDACYYALAAAGLNVHLGYTGLLNFGQAAFAAAGSYGIAIAVVTYGCVVLGRRSSSGCSPRSCSPSSSVSRRCACGVTTSPSSRSRRRRSSGSSSARSDTPRRSAVPTVFRGSARRSSTSTRSTARRTRRSTFQSDTLWLLLFSWPLVGLVCLWTWALMRSPWGRVIKGIREDEDAVRSLGKNTYWYKMQSLILGGVFGAHGRHGVRAVEAVGQPGRLRHQVHVHRARRADPRRHPVECSVRSWARSSSSVVSSSSTPRCASRSPAASCRTGCRSTSTRSERSG